MRFNSTLQMKDSLQIRVLRRAVPSVLTFWTILQWGLPRPGCVAAVNEWRLHNFPYLLRGLWKLAIARLFKIPHHAGAVYGEVRRADGTIEVLGLLGVQLVVTAGVNYIAARMANSSPSNISLFNFHALGTNNTAATIGDTALGTEWTNQYTGNVRPTGTQTNPSANVYQSVATNTMAQAGPSAVVEWGLLTQAATGGGTLLDHIIFAAINLSNSDQLTTTFQLTLAAGG